MIRERDWERDANTRTFDQVLDDVKELIESEYYDTDDAGYYYKKIYFDYNDELSEHQLSEISRADNPREKFDDIMSDVLWDNEGWYIGELHRQLVNIEGYEDYEEKIDDWIRDNVYYTIPYDHFNPDVDTIIAIDTGDMNYDFTCNNILNYCADGDGELDDNSSIKWLAKKQGKLTELRKALKVECGRSKKEISVGKFTKSVIQELYNSVSEMNMLIFGVSMPLFDFMKLRENIANDAKLNDSYYHDKRNGKYKFRLSKDTMCGLYEPYNGAGSCLEIEMEKDIDIESKDVYDVWLDYPGCKCNGKGYDVYDVYGIWRGCYQTGMATI